MRGLTDSNPPEKGMLGAFIHALRKLAHTKTQK